MEAERDAWGNRYCQIPVTCAGSADTNPGGNDKMSEAQSDLLGWAVVANISDHLRGGTEPDKYYQGTRSFSPGTRVYLGEAYWGMGGQNIHVVGLRRVSRQFINCAVHIGTIEALRVTSLYSPKLLRMLHKLRGQVFEDEAGAEAYLQRVSRAWQEDRPPKLKPFKRSGPWGPFSAEAYRIARKKPF